MAVIAALPAVGLQFWNEHDLRLARTQELQEQVLRLARQQSAEIDRLAEGARQFLVALAQIPQVNGADTAGCADLLIQIRANYRAYRAIIVAAALDLDWFAARLRDKLPQNASLTVVDRIGTIVVRFPENDLVRRGRPVPDEFRPRIYAAEPGVVHTRGLDGNMRVVGYVPIAASENSVYVSVGRDWDAAFADLNRSVRRAALIITAGFAFSLLLAWAWSEYGIRRPINELLGAVESWRGGRYARVGRERSRSELGRLARAFDELAQSLSARERELVESEERLKDRERYLSFVL